MKHFKIVASFLLVILVLSFAATAANAQIFRGRRAAALPPPVYNGYDASPRYELPPPPPRYNPPPRYDYGYGYSGYGYGYRGGYYAQPYLNLNLGRNYVGGSFGAGPAHIYFNGNHVGGSIGIGGLHFSF